MGDVAPCVPFMAARCVEESTARSAALEGSSVVSAIDLSCVVCVGEAFLGVAPIRILLCEYWRFTLLPVEAADGGVEAGGDMLASNE